jgi:outer membrane protein OmpA-like peptidoglycan-associated protein
MKSIAVLAVVSIFVLSGCGVNKREFEAWKESFTQQNAQERAELQAQISTVDSKLEMQHTSVVEAIERAKNEVTTGYEQADADTIKATKDFVKSENATLREELTKVANRASEKAQAFARSEDQKLLETMTQIENKTNAQAKTLTEVQNVLEEGGVARLQLAATVQFSSASASLTEAAQQELDEAITAIEAAPNATVMVTGHADGDLVRRGTYRSNWDLSQARADAVMKYLQAQGVKNPIRPVGRGDTEPIASFYTPAGKVMNRRAEVILYPSDPFLPLGMKAPDGDRIGIGLAKRDSAGKSPNKP